MNKQINKREKNTILNQKNKKGFNNKEINKENKTNEEENINMNNNLKLNPIYDIPELYNIDTKYRSKLNEKRNIKSEDVHLTNGERAGGYDKFKNRMKIGDMKFENIKMNLNKLFK